MPNVYDTRDTEANPATTENVTQVSSGNIRLIRNIYSDSASGDLIWNGRDRIYLSVPRKGLYTTGEFGHAGGKEAVAITGMGYCAGLVLARGHQTRLTNFFACHFSGGLLAFDSFQQVISDWMANTPTTNLLAFAAMGAAGSDTHSTAANISRFADALGNLTGINIRAVPFFTYAGSFVVNDTGTAFAVQDTNAFGHTGV